jgi:hypothetical protein
MPPKTEISPQPLQAKIVDAAIIMPRHQTASPETTTNYVSDSSGWSTESSVTASSTTSSSSVANQDRIIKILYQDKKLLALATKQQEEIERMRAARAMLYTAFLKAL